MIIESNKRKKKVADSVTYTTGSIQANIDHFNKMHGTYDGLPNVEIQKAAEEAAKAAGTFASQSPDGANSISMADAAPAAGGEGCAECGGGLTESVATSMPVTILPASDIKAYVAKLPPVGPGDLRPPKFFKLGYIKEIIGEIASKYRGGRGSTGEPFVRIFKCIEYSSLYTGYAWTRTNATVAADKQLGTARHTGEKTGYGFSDPDFVNKIGQYANGSEALQAYIASNSKQKVRFYISLNDEDLHPADATEVSAYLTPGNAYKVLNPASARTPAGFDAQGNAINDKPINRFKLSGIYMIGDLGKSLLEDFDYDEYEKELLTEAKRYVRRYYIRPQNIFASNKAEILKALIELDNENCSIYTLNNLEDNNDVTKLTNKDIIYYYDNGILYDKNHVKVMDYDLYIKHEEKRDNIDPEEVSDKTFSDVYDDRMTDQTVVEKYTPSYRMIDGDDIDYDYAFSKMDRFINSNDPDEFERFYNIHTVDEMVDFLNNNIDKEEFINRAGGDATVEDFAKYIIDNNLNESLDEALNLTFDSINAYGERLVEGKEVGGICCICGEEFDGYGNNPEPYMSAENGERCCDACNLHFVIPARLALLNKNRQE